jgi:Domain of unknown function (DUF3883)
MIVNKLTVPEKEETAMKEEDPVETSSSPANEHKPNYWLLKLAPKNTKELGDWLQEIIADDKFKRYENQGNEPNSIRFKKEELPPKDNDVVFLAFSTSGKCMTNNQYASFQGALVASGTMTEVTQNKEKRYYVTIDLKHKIGGCDLHLMSSPPQKEALTRIASQNSPLISGEQMETLHKDLGFNGSNAGINLFKMNNEQAKELSEKIDKLADTTDEKKAQSLATAATLTSTLTTTTTSSESEIEPNELDEKIREKINENIDAVSNNINGLSLGAEAEEILKNLVKQAATLNYIFISPLQAAHILAGKEYIKSQHYPRPIINSNIIGLWGEETIYQFLKLKYEFEYASNMVVDDEHGFQLQDCKWREAVKNKECPSHVRVEFPNKGKYDNWINNTAIGETSKLSYDLKVTKEYRYSSKKEHNPKVRYEEVKTTTHNANDHAEFGMEEIKLIDTNSENYRIYNVCNAGNKIVAKEEYKGNTFIAEIKKQITEPLNKPEKQNSSVSPKNSEKQKEKLCNSPLLTNANNTGRKLMAGILVNFSAIYDKQKIKRNYTAAAIADNEDNSLASSSKSKRERKRQKTISQ